MVESLVKTGRYAWLPGLLITLLCSVSHAGEQTGVVQAIITRSSDGLIHIYMSGTHTNRPPCATSTYWMIKDENSNTGKQQLAMLLLARATGQTISVSGTDSCTRWGDGEDLDAISL